MVAQMIDRPTLVLNRNWQPVNVATVARSLTMLWNETARVVDPADYQTYDWRGWLQLRAGLRDVQHAQGGPHAGPSKYAAAQAASTAEVEPAGRGSPVTH